MLQKILITNSMRTGDIRLLNASREQIRTGFRNPDESKSVEERLDHIEGVARFLRSNIVQGKKNESGKFRLNIHEHTELGDNESVKLAKKTLAAQNQGCCGGGAGLV